MTSSTDQEEASFPEPSLSCFKWSGPVVELAAVECGGKRKENQIKLTPLSNIIPCAHDFQTLLQNVCFKSQLEMS